MQRPLAAKPEPPRHCRRCPRLVAFRLEQRRAHPAWWNAPVPSFGDANPRALIVGLAPGLRGANRTGRPFTGDYAGELLFATLAKFGFTRGTYGGENDDGFELIDVRIPSAVRCVPPQNIAAPEEIRTCNRFLKPWIRRSPRLKAVVALGQVGHTAVIMAAGARQAAHKFGHGAEHDLGAFRLFDSYHCSRRNTNTGTLTTAMFEEVFGRVRRYIDRND
jgi:uracil-DNA glycosylase family 4